MHIGSSLNDCTCIYVDDTLELGFPQSPRKADRTHFES